MSQTTLLVFSLAASTQAPIPPQGPAIIEEQSYAWKYLQSEPDQIALFQGTKQIGNYSYSGGYYRPLKDGVWGKKVTSPPFPLPFIPSDISYQKYPTRIQFSSRGC